MSQINENWEVYRNIVLREWVQLLNSAKKSKKQVLSIIIIMN